jgi:hypothetical protein
MFRYPCVAEGEAKVSNSDTIHKRCSVSLLRFNLWDSIQISDWLSEYFWRSIQVAGPYKDGLLNCFAAVLLYEITNLTSHWADQHITKSNIIVGSRHTASNADHQSKLQRRKINSHSSCNRRCRIIASLSIWQVCYHNITTIDRAEAVSIWVSRYRG